MFFSSSSTIMSSDNTAIGQAIALVVGALTSFAVSQAYQKLLDKTNKLSTSLRPTINTTVPLTIHTTNPTNAESTHPSTVDSNDASSSDTTGRLTSNHLSRDETKDFIEKQKKIIQFVSPEQKEPLKGDNQLLARTMPNQGLTGTFGVHNAFTTYNLKVANDFKNSARLKLQKSINIQPSTMSDDRDGDWCVLIEYIRSTLKAELSRRDEVINLAELIQFLTLKVSLRYLFTDRPGLEDREAVKYVAKTINILWIRSKAFRINSNFATLAEQKWIHEHRFRDHLRTLTGADPDNPMKNPLNFILPAYETMWRAVSKGVLEVYFRGAPKRDKWKGLLFEFLDNPTRAEFTRGGTSKTLSAQDVIKEVMRIYPPTRHVYRQFPSEPLGQFHKANIEACHRLPLLAQKNPEWFRPERWLEIKLRYEKEGENQHDENDSKKPVGGKNTTLSLGEFEEELGFMPFATLCPAGKGFTQGFGFKMVALLVGSICEAFDNLNQKAIWNLEPESPSDMLPRLGQALKPSREDYLSLVYRKVADQSGGPEVTEEEDANAIRDSGYGVETEGRQEPNTVGQE